MKTITAAYTLLAQASTRARAHARTHLRAYGFLSESHPGSFPSLRPSRTFSESTSSLLLCALESLICGSRSACLPSFSPLAKSLLSESLSAIRVAVSCISLTKYLSLCPLPARWLSESCSSLTGSLIRIFSSLYPSLIRVSPTCRPSTPSPRRRWPASRHPPPPPTHTHTQAHARSKTGTHTSRIRARTHTMHTPARTRARAHAHARTYIHTSALTRTCTCI